MKPYNRLAIRICLVFLGLIVVAISVFCSSDFSPSWPYLVVLALSSVAAFPRIKSAVVARKEVATEGILVTANVTTVSLFLILAAVYLLAMPVGKLLTFTLGSSTHPVGTPIDHFHGGPRGLCDDETLVQLANGEQFWACGTAPYMAPSARIHLVESLLGYYASLHR